VIRDDPTVLVYGDMEVALRMLRSAVFRYGTLKRLKWRADEVSPGARRRGKVIGARSRQLRRKVRRELRQKAKN
jgi:ribosomal protein S21